VSAADAGGKILIDEYIKVVSYKRFGNNRADRLNSLAGLAADSNRNIHFMASFFFAGSVSLI